MQSFIVDGEVGRHKRGVGAERLRLGPEGAYVCSQGRSAAEPLVCERMCHPAPEGRTNAGPVCRPPLAGRWVIQLHAIQGFRFAPPLATFDRPYGASNRAHAQFLPLLVLRKSFPALAITPRKTVKELRSGRFGYDGEQKPSVWGWTKARLIGTIVRVQSWQPRAICSPTCVRCSSALRSTSVELCIVREYHR